MKALASLFVLTTCLIANGASADDLDYWRDRLAKEYVISGLLQPQGRVVIGPIDYMPGVGVNRGQLEWAKDRASQAYVELPLNSPSWVLPPLPYFVPTTRNTESNVFGGVK